MQNRLDAAREARAASERQLAEVQAAIAAERAARPESVRSARIFFKYLRVSPYYSYLVRGADHTTRRNNRNNARRH